MMLWLNSLITLVIFHLFLCLSGIRSQQSENKAVHPPLGNYGNPQLSYGGYLQQTNCLWLYPEPYRRGYPALVCYSTAYLSTHALSMCAPWSPWYTYRMYWLVYEQPGFTGSYILLSPGSCVNDIRHFGFRSVKSILLCIQITSFPYYPLLSCYYPQRPWREFTSVSKANADNSPPLSTPSPKIASNNQSTESMATPPQDETPEEEDS